MKLTAQIDTDIRCMSRYFDKMFCLLREAQTEDNAVSPEALDSNADESTANHHGVSHLIKPDMVMNIYSLVDFWLNKVCEYQKAINSLDLSSKDIKGKSDLHARHKYLTAYAGLNLEAVKDSYDRLDELRRVRNVFIHGGGHVPRDREKAFLAIKGIELSGSLIVIEDFFIKRMLDEAKRYLQAAVLA